MTREMTEQKTGGALAGIASLKKGLQNVQQTMPSVGTEPFLRMGTDGIWVYGAENIEVEEGSLWAVNVMSLKHGFSAWTDYKRKDKDDTRKNKKVGDVMVPSSQPIPPRSGLPEALDEDGDDCEWKEQYSVMLQCVTGGDKGEQVLYNTTSLGGTRAINDLISAVMAQLDADESKPVPVIALETDHYQHSNWGRTYVPLLIIKQWVPMEQTADAAMEQAEPEPEPEAPKRKRRRQAATEKPAVIEEEFLPAGPDEGDQIAAMGNDEPEDAPEETPVRRRRRRRAA